MATSPSKRTLPRFVAPLLVIVAGVVVIGLIATLTTKPPRSQGLGDDFLWGVASSGFQSEGNPPDSNWTRAANSPLVSDPVGTSVDFRHRYKDDIALAKDLGVKVYRIGIEWSRLEPRPGQLDEAEWAYYDDVVKTIKDAGIRPMITIDHWVYPGWVADQGGWTNPKTVEDWTVNASRVINRFAWADPLWVTINEPVAVVVEELLFHHLPAGQVAGIADRLVTAHNNAYERIHAAQPGAMVTSNVAYLPGPGLEDQVDVLTVDKMKLDYIGVDYYYASGPPAGATLDDFLSNPSMFTAASKPWEQQLQPEGVYYALRHYARRFPGKPLYIVENGMPTEDHKPRADAVTRAQQIHDTVYWVGRAKADGMPVIGYNYWSITDNYEWGSYHPRFGLYTVDVATDPTLARVPTDGVAAYRKIIAEHGVPASSEPTLKPVPCSQVDAPSSCEDPVRLRR
ncbi:glycoside hydrolase family 1 [Segniliparus rotundus DSM 44985]|uniref:Glycoside hydrolase family 1 n=1 Tax=Segniliparus rotundus (strain ATCC BAA-972 / CDC 1076 / CIP 108378 / DSM 44985 / JCM 13578) TaxID=640132 RepID=D6ZED3_SEGRD|nr:family 1 glycosylhydrolase [Segniliparus rotundus]ADG99409.1 glycoside hydrolase family 1 [Segniliparus rotundus DSM 44985]